MVHWNRFLKRKQNVLGLLLVAAFVFMAVTAPLLAPPADPADPQPFKIVGQSLQRMPRPPSEESILGTTPQIRDLPRFGFMPGQDVSYEWDVLYTVIWGSRSALRFGLIVTLTTALFGIAVGAVSGYVGGTFNNVVMRITDAFLAFPAIAAIWLFQRAFFTNVNDIFFDPLQFTSWERILYNWRIDPIMLALIVFSWMPYARVINTLVSQLKQSEYVFAARSMGAGHARIIFRHLLPNAIAPAIVLAARDVGGMVVLASAFIFIGFAGNVAWGIMLVSARDYVIGLGGNPFVYWWTFLPVSLALVLFSIGWNLLGDGLNNALNPYARR